MTQRMRARHGPFRGYRSSVPKHLIDAAEVGPDSRDFLYAPVEGKWVERAGSAILGDTGYQRNREAEFGARNVPREQVFQGIDQAIAAVRRTLAGLSDAELDHGYPEPVAGVRLNTGDFLIHLASHLAYHLGQVDYHRRIVTAGGPLGASVSPTRLWSAEKAS